MQDITQFYSDRSVDMGDGRPGLTLDNHCFDESFEFVPQNQPHFNLSTSEIQNIIMICSCFS